MHTAETLPALLKRAASNADAPFLLDRQRTWTYGEFAQAVDTFAEGLARLGTARFDRVAIAAPNSSEWLITWFAVAKLGATLVTLNVAYREREFDHMLNQSGAKLLVCAARDGAFDFVEFLDRLRPRFAGVREFVFIGGAGFAGSHRWEDVATASDGKSLQGIDAQVNPSDPSVILYTSGTTGEPKGATLTHGSILASAAAQAAHLEQGPSDVVIGHMPLNHVGGMTCTIAAAIIAGAQVVLLPKYSPSAAVEAIRTYRVTVFVGVPTMYTLLFAEPAFATNKRLRKDQVEAARAFREQLRQAQDAAKAAIKAQQRLEADLVKEREARVAAAAAERATTAALQKMARGGKRGLSGKRTAVRVSRVASGA